LEALTKGMPRAEAYRLIAALVRHEIVNMRDGEKTVFDAKALRRQWRAERRAAVANGRAIVEAHHVDDEIPTDKERFATHTD
jgi:DNA-binding IclR family transcriptional regulator